MYNDYKLNLFLFLICKFDQKSNFQPIALIRPYKSQKGTKWEKNMVLKGCEWYYIVSMYNYY